MRAIDADALEELFREVIGRISKRPDINFNMEHMIRASAMVIEMIKDAPTIQPEIVRCKDCKYAEYIDDVKTLWCTECGQGRTVAPYDFCSLAERREVTT